MKEQPHSRLRRARELRNWSQETLAEKIGTISMNVSRWERGKTRPLPYFREQLCQLFGMSALDLGLLAIDMQSEDNHGAALPTPVESSDGPSPLPPLIDPALPLPLTTAGGLVGREGELIRLRERLHDGHTVALTALNGLPGVGKTALAVALARDPQVRQWFPDGVLWAGLGPQPNILGTLARWGTLLGLPEERIARLTSLEEWGLALRSALGERRLLIVIDDAWRIEDALALRVGGVVCAYLLTTRRGDLAAHFAGESLTLRELSEEDGLKLLSLLAPLAVRNEPVEARALVQAVGGLPLAIALIGRYLHLQARTGQPRRLRAAIERLRTSEERLRLSEPQTPPERYTGLPQDTPLSLHAVIGTSVSLLSEESHQSLLALSAFPPRPNTFSEEAALAVTASSGDVLDHLVDAGLIESSGPERYSLHQTIADYTHLQVEKLPTEASLKATILGRLTDYFAWFVETHEYDYQILTQESENVFAALEAAYEGEMHMGLVRLANAFSHFLEARGLYAQAHLHLQRAQHATQELANPNLLAGILLRLGRIAQKRSNFNESEAYCQEGLVLARQSDLPELICAFLAKLGWIAEKQGRYAQAEAYLQEGLTLARQHGFRKYLPDLLNELGTVTDDHHGDTEQARRYYQEGLAEARELGDREQMCVLLLNLATIHSFGRGEFTQVEAYTLEALELTREIGHREYICVLLVNFGTEISGHGQYPRAIAYLQEALVMAREIDHREWAGHALSNLGSITGKLGEYAQAEAYLQEALALAREIGKPWLMSSVYLELGDLALVQQQLERADECYQQALVHLPEGGNPLLSAYAQYGLARVAAARGNLETARTLGTSSLTILETAGPMLGNEVKEWLLSLHATPQPGKRALQPLTAKDEQHRVAGFSHPFQGDMPPLLFRQERMLAKFEC